VARTELPIPPTVMAMAEAVCSMLKAVFSGRGDERVDLARTNLWH